MLGFPKTVEVNSVVFLRPSYIHIVIGIKQSKQDFSIAPKTAENPQTAQCQLFSLPSLHNREIDGFNGSLMSNSMTHVRSFVSFGYSTIFSTCSFGMSWPTYINLVQTGETESQNWSLRNFVTSIFLE